jgi:hypothetical protein
MSGIAVSIRGARARVLLLVAMVLACTPDSALVAGSTDSYEFAARVRHAIPRGTNEAAAARTLTTRGFGCTHTDTLQSEDADTLEANESPEDPGTEFLTCDYVRRRRWGESTQRRYLVVLYLREHRVDRVFAVTHLREVH